MRVFAAAIVILLAAFGKPAASLDPAARQRGRASVVTTGEVMKDVKPVTDAMS